MRLATIRTAAGTRAARIEGDVVVELSAPDLGALLASGADPAATHAPGPVHDLAAVDFAPVVPRPDKVLCLGLNYRAHILEMGHDLPDHPTVFSKFAVSLVGARDDIWLPPESEKVDWEAELGIVIGRPVRRASAAEARAAIAGFTVVNDVSMRDWQYRTQQWDQGKTWEHATPVGPWLVSPDEVDDARDLRVACTVDGVVVQDGRTADLLFDPVETVRYLSTVCTLVPGDLISTGTPAGVGHGRVPPVYLRPGQELRTTIEGVGELVNRCVAEPVSSDGVGLRERP
ncbi:MAG: fumarylacetoacetate hydrolase family protein [Actinobacteria bacterium]|nr:fumarylacetoacetate hydrolase family protein [Actinomycetota bacterium]